MKLSKPVVLVRGGGDLATGVAVRLHRCGFSVVVTEIGEPLAVRRLVAFAQAVYAGDVQVEDAHGRLVHSLEEIHSSLSKSVVPVLVDPEAHIRESLKPAALVDGRMRKAPPELGKDAAPLVIGLGPGFVAGENCHAVVETNRGHHLGRVYWQGLAERDTSIPEPVTDHDKDRVLRAPATGPFEELARLGSRVRKGERLGRVLGVEILAPFDGVLRGLIHAGVMVEVGDKVGDLDPRGDPSYCTSISDKALAVGGGVLEALLSSPVIRSQYGG